MALDLLWYSSLTPPLLPGVYRVLYIDHTGIYEEVNGFPFLAYWDGVDMWSYPWNRTEDEAYRAKMNPGVRFRWRELHD